MITECYIKGRYDFGSGRCAVVITEDTKQGSIKQVLHKVAWKVPDEWEYNGETIKADQYNCEILAATYALQWCMQNKKSMINLYFNTKTCQKWYLREEFPESRLSMAKAYCQAVKDYYDALDAHDRQVVYDRVYVEWIPKDTNDARYAVYNALVNNICENVK